ncbi:MAG: zinc-ribbon domain-containing protein [Candidatus Coproplasma sp.]
MAIIKCPKCNKEISSHAKLCIHCGTKINVCPKCGKAFDDGSSHCPNCGFQYTNTVPSNESVLVKSSNDSNFNDLQQMWLTRKASEKSFDTICNLIDLFLMIVTAIPIILIPIKYFTWQSNNSSVPIVDQINSLSCYFITLTIFAVIGFELSIIIRSVFYILKENSRYKWFKTNKFEYKDFIKSLNSSSLQNTKKGPNKINTTEVEKSAFFAYNHGYFKLLIVGLIVSIVLAIPTMALIILSFPNIVIQLMYAKEGLIQSFMVDQVYYLLKMLFAGVVIFFISVIINGVILLIPHFKSEKWAESLK